MTPRPSPRNRLRRCARAATAVEYGLIVAVIVLGIMASLIAVGDTSTGIWSTISQKVMNAR